MYICVSFFQYIYICICHDNPIIHLSPLTAWAFMTDIHPLRNLLIGVLGSGLGACLGRFVFDFRKIGLDQLGLSLFGLSCFCMFSSFAKKILNISESLVCFSEGFFANIQYQRLPKPRNLKLKLHPHFCSWKSLTNSARSP